MPKGLVNESSLNSIAEAINVLNGSEGTYLPSEMGDEIINAIPTETVSGNPIHITDAAAYPAESVVTTLEPVQDLHGYSNPWPAGGGEKQLFPLTDTEIKSRGTWDGNILITHGITFEILHDGDGNVTGIKANGTAIGDAQILLGRFVTDGVEHQYTFSGVTAGSSGVTWYTRFVARKSDGTAIGIDHSVFIDVYTTVVTKTIPSDCAFIDGYVGVSNGKTANNLVFQPMICLASVADPTFEPYSNICPISGHTEIALTRTGKNLASISTGNNVAIGTVKQGQSYTFSCDNTGAVGVNLKKNNSLGSILTSTHTATSESKIILTFMPDEDCEVFINGWSDQAGGFAAYATNFQLELGSTATTYEPYTPETHSITFPQAQSPVYGCEVDWINGVLKVTEVSKIYDGSDDEGWGFLLTDPDAYFFKGEVELTTKAWDKISTNYLKTITSASDRKIINSVWIVYTQIHLHLSDKIIPSGVGSAGLSELKTYLASNPLQVCYPLDTPLEIPLTPEVIALLKGENNVWTDSGTSEIEYKVDLQSYIQKLINEASAQANTLSMSPLSLGKSAAVSTDGADRPIEESEEAEELPVEDVESVDEADEVEEEPAEVEEVIYKPIDVKEPDTLEKEGGDSD